ncbi:MAG TPA: chemotaxis protein CheW [Baekduia sp.]|nr:chemotaxis protein CheW [Baekduia sp.]
MKAVLVLDAELGRFALDVLAARAVLEPHGLVALPSPRPGVLGLLRPERHALPVLDRLGSTGRHVVVVETAGRRFGLLVGRVDGVEPVAADAVSPPPPGQDEPIVAGRVATAAETLLLLDPDVLLRVLA